MNKIVIEHKCWLFLHIGSVVEVSFEGLVEGFLQNLQKRMETLWLQWLHLLCSLGSPAFLLQERCSFVIFVAIVTFAWKSTCLQQHHQQSCFKWSKVYHYILNNRVRYLREEVMAEARIAANQYDVEAWTLLLKENQVNMSRQLPSHGTKLLKLWGHH